MSEQSQELQELFGSFRAEWLRERLFSLFNEPEYFPSLKDSRPCVLMGGRGSGKTTALRCMSYEGQLALNSNDVEKFRQLPYVGLYYRVNTNRVTAFRGPEQAGDEWKRAFSHYLNLTIVEMVLVYLRWHRDNISSIDGFGTKSCGIVSVSLGLEAVHDLDALVACVGVAKQALEIYVNNLDAPPPKFSMLQSPIDAVIGEVRKLSEFSSKTFYVMIDEYENFLDYQQSIVNTLIKHSSDSYVFKIGVKELGWRVRYTLNDREQLISPADYELIHIEEKLEGNFSEFARQVCETRIAQWATQNGVSHLSLNELLVPISYEEEAALLGVDERVRPFRDKIAEIEENGVDLFSQPGLVLYVFWMLNDQRYDLAIDALREYVSGNVSAVNKYHNYKYALLFAIPPNGAEVGKYYCGNRVFALLARNNMRFYLQLIAASLDRHLRSGKKVSEPVDPRLQTEAARAIGLQYLTELEGVTVQGAQLVKLVLGFGRLFQLLSRNPIGGRPECVEFQIRHSAHETTEQTAALAGLLREGVMQLALVRSGGTKLATESDIKEWDYGVHPIFAPYFNFSHRKKRKIEVDEVDVLNMVANPRSTIRRLLKERAYLVEQEAPSQMKLFDEYFSGQHGNAAPR